MNAGSSRAPSASTRSFRRRFDGSRLFKGRTLSECRRILLTAATAAAMSSSLAFAQQAPGDDRCKAADTDRQTDNGQADNRQAAPTPDGNSSKKLSDCGGVLKPPAVGDSQMEKPAPKVGRTPVIKPGDPRNNQQPGK